MHDAKNPPNMMRPAVLGAKGTTVFSGSRESKTAQFQTEEGVSTLAAPGRWDAALAAAACGRSIARCRGETVTRGGMRGASGGAAASDTVADLAHWRCSCICLVFDQFNAPEGRTGRASLRSEPRRTRRRSRWLRPLEQDRETAPRHRTFFPRPNCGHFSCAATNSLFAARGRIKCTLTPRTAAPGRGSDPPAEADPRRETKLDRQQLSRSQRDSADGAPARSSDAHHSLPAQGRAVPGPIGA
jgi:hypothetical protein